MVNQNENNKDNNVQRQIKQSASSQPISNAVPGAAPVRDSAFYKGLYTELHSTARFSLTTNIKKERIEQEIKKIVEAFREYPYNELLLLSYTSSKDDYLPVHITNDVILSVGFAVHLGLSSADALDVGVTAFCHDFGMAEYLGLFQKTVKFTDEENIMIQQHSKKSADIFKDIFPEKIIHAILDIHEQANGKGYPQGKTSIEISTIGKIVAICDAFEALTHPRKYRKAFTPYEAIKMIIKQKDIIFDPKILKKFVNYLSIYPIGSLVYLNTGETAVVVGANANKPTRSIVQILLNIKREVDHARKVINLLEDSMLYIRGCVESKEEAEILHFLKPRGENEIS